mmetsp:Transcript_27237/g.37411  ORF Transcript_27237/g.37411 Transcript_27237/m.37411 type:complete len:938 (+) Transcript_27237:1783-4596(+)
MSVVLQYITTPVFDVSSPQIFTTICSPNLKESQRIFNYTCPGSGQLLMHNCKDRIGTLKSYCPVFKPSCQTLTKNGAFQSSNCVLLNHSATEIMCECEISDSSIVGKSRLLLDGVNSIEETSGAMQLVAISEYVTADVVHTFTAAPNLNSPENIEKVLSVIVMFAAMWLFALVIIATSYWRKTRTKLQKRKLLESFLHRKRIAEKAQSNVAVREFISAYVLQIIPAMFRAKQSVHQCVDEVLKFHRYFVLLFEPANSTRNSYRFRVMTALELVSTQCLLFFLLALFYNLQSPADDGTCIQMASELQCLERKSPLDPYQTYCSWSVDSGCAYQTPVFTQRMILAMTMLISVTTSIFLRPMGYLFELLSAPTANSNNNSNDLPASTVSTITHATQPFLYNKKVSTRNIVGVEACLIPNDAENAQEVAHVSASLITVRANSLLHRHHANVAALLFKLRREESFLNENEYEDSSSISSNELASLSLSFSRSITDSHPDIVDHVVDADGNVSAIHNSPTIHDRFLESIRLQRMVLRSSAELKYFDAQWGIESSAETLQFQPHILRKIFRVIDNVAMLARGKVEMLKLASNKHTGIEIIHLFIVDLLGRDTTSAKIFEQKIRDDFKRTQIVTMFAKYLAGMILFLMNILFAYYCVLFGFVQGVAWQRQYLFACIVQMLVEIFINETLEVVWMNFCVPSLVMSNSMQKVITLIEESIDQLCDSTPPKDVSPSLINAPDYLFVSTKVAMSFPNLMESIFVRTFITHLPGEFSKHWIKSSWWSDVKSVVVTAQGTQVFRVVSAVAVILAINSMKFIATAPYELQRMFVRLMQPFLLSGIILIYNMVIESPTYISLFFGGFCFAVAYVMARYIRDGIAIRRDLNHLVHLQIVRWKALWNKKMMILLLHLQAQTTRSPIVSYEELESDCESSSDSSLYDFNSSCDTDE